MSISQAKELSQQLRELANRIQNIQSDSLAEADLTPQQLALLSVLDSRERATNAELSEAMRLSKGTTSGMLKRLTERNLVTKAQDPDDRRLSYFTLSEKGRSMADQFAAWEDGMYEGLFSEATHAELAAWLRTLERLNDLLARHEADCEA